MSEVVALVVLHCFAEYVTYLQGYTLLILVTPRAIDSCMYLLAGYSSQPNCQQQHYPAPASASQDWAGHRSAVLPPPSCEALHTERVSCSRFTSVQLIAQSWYATMINKAAFGTLSATIQDIPRSSPLIKRGGKGGRGGCTMSSKHSRLEDDVQIYGQLGEPRPCN